MSPFEFNTANAVAAIFSILISGVMMATAIAPATSVGAYV
jgi:hypothetical protein